MPSNSQVSVAKYDPDEIAEWLIEEHGPEDAGRLVLDYIFKAQDAGDNYRLSIWREVRQVLAGRAGDASQYQSSP
jgi:hypothetical protein